MWMFIFNYECEIFAMTSHLKKGEKNEKKRIAKHLQSALIFNAIYLNISREYFLLMHNYFWQTYHHSDIRQVTVSCQERLQEITPYSHSLLLLYFFFRFG